MLASIRTRIVATLVALALCQLTQGQEQPIRLTDLAPQTSRLIRLKAFDQGIRIDSDHWKRMQTRSSEELMDERAAMHRKRGLSSRAAKFLAEQRINIDWLDEFILFEDLAIAANATGGLGGGTGKSSLGSHAFRKGKSTSLHMELSARNPHLEKFNFMIREHTAPFTELAVSSHQVRGLRIQVCSDNQILVFWQSYEGGVRVTYSKGEHNKAIHAESYQDFLASYPDLAKEFWSQLNGLGIDKPLQRDDPAIAKGIAALLRKTESSPVKEADATIRLLSDDDVKVRQAARKKVEASSQRWRIQISRALRKTDVDPETRIVLESIVKQAKEKSKAAESEIDCFIREHKLLDDREYLTSIVNSASEEAKLLIRDRIAELEK